MSSFENHSSNLHIGKKVCNVTVISVTAKRYIVQCDCGKKMYKQIHIQIPQMCKNCAKIQHRSNFVPGDSDYSYSIRPNTPEEDKMIKKFLKENK